MFRHPCSCRRHAVAVKTAFVDVLAAVGLPVVPAFYLRPKSCLRAFFYWHPLQLLAPLLLQAPLLYSRIRNTSTSVADPDPGSGAFLTPGSGMSRMSASGSGTNNPDHIF